MKRQYVSGLIEGQRVDTVVALRSKEMRSARTGEAYLSMELADRTGRIGGLFFKPDASAAEIPSGTAVRVRGLVTSFRGTRRVSIESLRPAERYDREDLVAGGRRDRREGLREMKGLIAAVRDEDYGRLLRAVFGDREFMARFTVCPASQSYHHAYAGGLLDHTVAVASTAASLGPRYEEVDASLLVTAALLHDIGKVDELEAGLSVSYTDEGRMLGHVVLGDRRVGRAIASLGDFPSEKATRLSHVVLSHHGELEWGAPKRPCTLEALLVHHVDNLDAKITGFIEATRGAALVEEKWTDAANLFRRPLYAPRAAEDDRQSYPEEDVQYVRAG